MEGNIDVPREAEKGRPARKALFDPFVPGSFGQALKRAGHFSSGPYFAPSYYRRDNSYNCPWFSGLANYYLFCAFTDGPVKPLVFTILNYPGFPAITGSRRYFQAKPEQQ